jgi:hypothetical protein
MHRRKRNFPTKYFLRLVIVKEQYVTNPCHSEERSDEESRFLRCGKLCRFVENDNRYRATLPPAAKSISTESLTFKNSVLGFFIPHFS